MNGLKQERLDDACLDQAIERRETPVGVGSKLICHRPRQQHLAATASPERYWCYSCYLTSWSRSPIARSVASPWRLADVPGMPKDDDLVTTSFIATSLRVSRQTVWRWVRDKKIRATAIKVGSRTVFRIRYSEYRRFLERYVRGEDD